MKAEGKKAAAATSSRQRATYTRRERDLGRMIKCCEGALTDHAAAKLPDVPDAGAAEDAKAKVYEYGEKTIECAALLDLI